MAEDIKHYLGKIQTDDWLVLNNKDKVSKKISTFEYFPKTFKKQIQFQIKKQKKTKEFCEPILFIQIKHQKNNL